VAARLGLSKAEIRRLVLGKLSVVHREWGIAQTPFARTGAGMRQRRDDPRALVVARVAALLGGLSEAIDRNTRALAAALDRRRPASPPTAKRRPPARGARGQHR
jgi:uncharacterized protein HemY